MSPLDNQEMTQRRITHSGLSMWGVNLCNYELTKSKKSHCWVLRITLLITYSRRGVYFTLSIVTHSAVMVGTILIF